VLALLLAAVVAAVHAGAAPGSTLVLIDDMATRDTHSQFFDDLIGKGFKLKFAKSDSSSLAVIKYGELAYENIIIFAPRTEEFGGALSPEAIANFVDMGGNVLAAGSSEVGEPLRDLATECGFEMDEEGTAVIDHFHNKNSDPTMVTSSALIDAEIIVGPKSKEPIVFRGVGMVADLTNPLVLPILSGSSTAYSYVLDKEIDDYPHAIGKSTVLVGGLQARNNARVVISGSLDLFSNSFFASSSANRQFAVHVAQWAFKAAGELRIVGEPVHHRVGESSPPSQYTINDNVEFSITMEEKVNGKWVPFKGKDVQLAFHRIDPFVIIDLDNNNGKMTTTFTLPDVYGVFQFIVDYQRVGYTFVFSSTQAPVRPFRHNQYERFIYSAYPYYSAALSMMFGVFVFSFVYLHHKSKLKDE
jgi:oligosaccharyltransferase complex subunit beta